MKNMKRIISLLMILMLVFLHPLTSYASDISGYKPKGYPTFPKISQKYYIIYTEGFRNNRLEVCFFNIKKTGELTPTITWSGTGVDCVNGIITNDVKYFLEDGSWIKFEEDYGRVSDNASKIKVSNLNIYNHEGKRVVKKTNIKYIKFTNAKLSLSIGDKLTLSYKTNIAGTVKFKTSASKVVSVTSKGKIKALKKGTATITATAKNGAKSTCKITIK